MGVTRRTTLRRTTLEVARYDISADVHVGDRLLLEVFVQQVEADVIDVQTYGGEQGVLEGERRALAYVSSWKLKET